MKDNEEAGSRRASPRLTTQPEAESVRVQSDNSALTGVAPV